MTSRYDQPDSDDERGLRPETIRRSCANCLGDVFVGREEPWTLVVWCQTCLSRYQATGHGDTLAARLNGFRKRTS